MQSGWNTPPRCFRCKVSGIPPPPPRRGAGVVTFMQMDLDSPASIRAFATRLAAGDRGLDMLARRPPPVLELLVAFV